MNGSILPMSFVILITKYMKTLILLLLPFLSFSQVTANIQAGADFPIDLKPGFSLRASAGIKTGSFFLGLGTGVTKLGTLDNAYIPFFGNITYMPLGRKINPVLTVQPGVGVYSDDFDNKGGFTAYGGVGLGGKRIQFTLGYSYFGFSHTSFSGPSFRLGATL
jgi:hypothetical protein